MLGKQSLLCLSAWQVGKALEERQPYHADCIFRKHTKVPVEAGTVPLYFKEEKQLQKKALACGVTCWADHHPIHRLQFYTREGLPSFSSFVSHPITHLTENFDLEILRSKV